jgi:hypothetical protein
MTLSPADSLEEDAWKDYTKNRETPMGSLGDKLLEAMRSKKG